MADVPLSTGNPILDAGIKAWVKGFFGEGTPGTAYENAAKRLAELPPDIQREAIAEIRSLAKIPTRRDPGGGFDRKDIGKIGRIVTAAEATARDRPPPARATPAPPRPSYPDTPPGPRVPDPEPLPGDPERDYEEERLEYEYDLRAEGMGYRDELTDQEERRLSLERNFVDDRPLPRVPSKVDRFPGRGAGGQAGAIVGGIIGLIELGKAIWEIRNTPEPLPKGPKSRPKGKITLEDPEEITIRQRKRTLPKVDQTTRRAIERTNETQPDLEEIKVTARRRALPKPAKPGKVGTTPARGLTIDVDRVLGLYEAYKRSRDRRQVIQDRPPPVIGEPVPEPQTRRTRGPVTGRIDLPSREPGRDLDPLPGEWRQDARQNLKKENKTCVKEKEQRVRCYKGLYRERSGSTRKTRWQAIDCTTGKEL